MELGLQKRLAASIGGCSKKRVVFDVERLDEIKEAITKVDIRGLIKDNAIKIRKKRGISRFRIRKNKAQKRKGRQKGFGSRKGSKNARLENKREWINKARLQRKLLNTLKKKRIITNNVYRELYWKVKGGFFRSKRHIKLYIEEHNLAVKK